MSENNTSGTIDNSAVMALIQEFTKALNVNSGNRPPRTTEPPTYDGSRDAMIIDSWIRTFERYTDYQGWDSVQKKRYAVTLLRGRADTWYRTLETSEEEPENWLAFKRELIEFFRPDDSARLARDRLAVYRQMGSLNNYVNEFMDIIAAIPGITEDESCDKFMRGLSNRDTRSQVRQAQATTLREAIRVAIAHDSAIHENPSFYRRNVGAYIFNRNSTPRGPYAGEPMDLSMMSSSRGNVRCHYCDKVGHIRRHCKIRSEDIRKMEQKRYNELKKNHGAASSKDFH